MWIAGGLVLAVAALGLLYRLFRPRPPSDATEWSYQCPNCRRKTRYDADLAGRPSRCPQCKERFVFPPPPKAWWDASAP